jgi:hypothetical protein
MRHAKQSVTFDGITMITKTEDTRIPFITLVILILLAFIPFFYAIMLYGIGVYLYFFENVINTTNGETLDFVILFSGVISLVGFYFATKTGYKILWTFMTVFFLSGYFAFVTENIKYEKLPYFLPLMISGIIVTAPLILVGFIKERKLKVL